MARRFSMSLLAAICASILAMVLGILAVVKTKRLSLPLPLTLPALNVVLPVLTLAAMLTFRAYLPSIQSKAIRLALPYLAYGSTLAPFILFVLSMIYAAPGDLQSCAADRQWLRMFVSKDSASIRSIQSRLQCCGYNSMHDRAWPFPSQTTDSRACERTLGFTTACGRLWRGEESSAATLTAVSSFINWLVAVLIAAHSQIGEPPVRLPAWSESPSRLITDTSVDEEEDLIRRSGADGDRVWEEGNGEELLR